MEITKTVYGTTSDGDVDLFSLVNDSGMKAEIINYGAIVVSLRTPDRDGKSGDIVLGFDSLEGYIEDGSYQGAIVGRVGNRIGGASFELDGLRYELARNDNGVNHLHGGITGFNKVLWDARVVESGDEPSLKLTYISRDGEEGYPGTLTLSVTYALTAQNGLKITYLATTDKPTILNPTHHSYFNLAGEGNESILDHELTIFADRFTPVGEGLIPTGEILNVGGTPLDFRTPHLIGERIDQDDEQLRLGLGYDHNFVINDYNGAFKTGVQCYDAKSGRFMEVLTTEPGMQFYSGNFLDGTMKGKKGKTYSHRSAFCFEPGHFPNSINTPGFPSIVLRPGETYSQVTEYRFSVK